MPKVVFIVLFLILANVAKAQITQVSGIITDYQSGEAIHGAIISDSGRVAYTYANRHGYYNLGLDQGKHVILISAAGFAQKSVVLSVFRTEELNVELTLLDPLETDTNSNKQLTTKDYRSGYSAPLTQQVKDMPAIMNEPDPIKFLQMLPGVSGGIEGLSGLYVRGGNGDQNLVTMDGLPIYGNGHLFGFLSNFNSDQVRDVQFYRGVLPARYGGRAGAAIDCSMNDGNNVETRATFQADPLAVRLNADMPLNSSGTTTGSFGFRRSWIDALLAHSGDSFLYYNLYDLNAKIVFRPNPKNKIAFWVYNGRDKFGQKLKEQIDSLHRTDIFSIEQIIKWANTLAGINFSHRFNPRHFGTVMVGMSRYTFSNELKFSAEVIRDTGSRKSELELGQKNAITDFTLKADFEFNINSTTYLRYGMEATNHNFKPAVVNYKTVSNSNNLDTTFGKSNIQGAFESSLYAEVEKRMGVGLKMDLGARIWQFSAAGKTWVKVEPRIFISQMLEGNKAIKASFGIAHQGVNQLASVNGNLPTDVWVPASAILKPQQSIQGTLGYFQPWKKGLEFSIEGYYKRLTGVTDLKGNDEGYLEKNYCENLIVQGNGNAYGMEAMLMRKHGKLNGLVSYTFALSNRTFEDLNFGKQFPFRWDRRHRFTLQGVYYIKSYFKINFAVVLMSGNAVSVPTGKYVAADGTFVFDYSEKNNFRMPFYKRLDFGFSKQIRPFSNSTRRKYWGVNVYNLFGFYNPLFVKMDKDKQGIWTAKGQAFFRFVPSAFYRWEF